MQSIRSTRTKLLIAAIPFAFIALVVFASSSTVNVTSAATPSEHEMALFNGQSDYEAHCSTCHGGNGKGQTAKGRKTHAGDLTKSAVSDAKGIRMMKNGKGEMPAFGSKMNDAQLQQVMNYIRGFRN